MVGKKTLWILIPALLLGFVACSDVFSDVLQSSYNTQAEAMQSGLVKRGWLPDWLPAQATNISELHNIDTNTVVIWFDLPAKALPALLERCQPAQNPPSPHVRSSRVRIPKPGTGQIYACDQYFMQPQKGRVLLWN